MTLLLAPWIFIPSYGHDYSSNVGHLKRMVELTVRGHLFFVAPALHSKQFVKIMNVAKKEKHSDQKRRKLSERLRQKITKYAHTQV